MCLVRRIQCYSPMVHLCNNLFGFVAEDGTRHCKITQSHVNFITKDCMPFSVVGGVGFRRLMKETVPLFKLPTRNTIKSLIVKKYDVLSCDFKNVVRERIQYAPITANVWSNMMTITSYLGRIISWMVSQSNHQHLVSMN